MTNEQIANEAAQAANACVSHYSSKKLSKETIEKIKELILQENCSVSQDWINYAAEYDRYVAGQV